MEPFKNAWVENAGLENAGPKTARVENTGPYKHFLKTLYMSKTLAAVLDAVILRIYPEISFS